LSGPLPSAFFEQKKNISIYQAVARSNPGMMPDLAPALFGNRGFADAQRQADALLARRRSVQREL